MPKQEKRVLAVVNDLLFTVKLTDAAKRTGLALEIVKDSGQLMEKAASKPSLIIFDLNYAAIDPLDLVRKLKENAETKTISLIGYLSHVQVDLKQAAQEAGCDMVMARSAFSTNLYQIFRRHAGVV